MRSIFLITHACTLLPVLLVSKQAKAIANAKAKTKDKAAKAKHKQKQNQKKEHKQKRKQEQKQTTNGWKKGSYIENPVPVALKMLLSIQDYSSLFQLACLSFDALQIAHTQTHTLGILRTELNAAHPPR